MNRSEPKEPKWLIRLEARRRDQDGKRQMRRERARMLWEEIETMKAELSGIRHEFRREMR